MEVGIGKGVRDPKGHAVARHECNISFLLLFMVSVKLQIIYLKYFIPIAWGIFMGIPQQIPARTPYYHIPRKEWRS